MKNYIQYLFQVMFFTLTVMFCLNVFAVSIVKGPYLQNKKEYEITIMCQTDVETSCKVQFGTLENNMNNEVNSSATRLHKIKLENLTSNTKYFYKVICAETESSKYHFSTSVRRGTNFEFIVYGDNRSNHDQHTQVVQAILDVGPTHFLMNTGDMVSDGEVEEDWVKFFEIEKELLALNPIYPAIGNHETYLDKAENFEKYFAPPEESSGTKDYYYFDYSNSRFIVIDSHIHYSLLGFSRDQKNWMLEKAGEARDNPDIKHIFLFVHMGPYSSKSGRTGNYYLRSLLDELDGAGVNVVFSGHDHYMEYGTGKNDMQYCISGAGGAPLYDTNGPGQKFSHNVLYSEAHMGFVQVKIEGGKMTADIKDETGAIRYTFTYGEIGEQPPECVQGPDCEGLNHSDCPGSWNCVNNECYWECEQVLECIESSDCDEREPLTNECEGAWNCDEDNKCIWICDVEFECITNDECADNEPLLSCDGFWQCMDGVCEWKCEQLNNENNNNSSNNINNENANSNSADSLNNSSNDMNNENANSNSADSLNNSSNDNSENNSGNNINSAEDSPNNLNSNENLPNNSNPNLNINSNNSNINSNNSSNSTSNNSQNANGSGTKTPATSDSCSCTSIE